jgi:AAA15 family ATPase/GTPase
MQIIGDKMILKFKIKNHLSIKNEIVLDFQATKKDKHFNFFCEEIGKYKVLKIAMLFGPNASGKSNILHALDRFRNIVLNDNLNKNDAIRQIPFEFDPISQKSPTVFEIEFLINSDKFSYRIEYNDKFILSENLYIFDPNKTIYFNRVTENKTGKVLLVPGNKFNIDEVDRRTIEGNTLPNMTILSGYNKTSLQIQILKKSRDWFEYYLNPIIAPRIELTDYVKSKLHKDKINKKMLISLLEKADFNICDTIIDEFKITKEMVDSLRDDDLDLYEIMKRKMGEKNEMVNLNLYFQHLITIKNKELTYKLQSGLESQGTIRYFGLSGVLTELFSKPGILNIDELESSLHPDLLYHFINTFMLNTNHSQLIFTSHYFPLLEDTDELRKDIVWFTEKREDGSTDLFSLKDINIRASLNYYKAYKTGKLGAKPFIGSAYIPKVEVKNE